ncbi:MAG TPA: non-ribosomal peptide synthetase [Pyrinomonadaceae bacterium]|jgi:amino acid adenylation domain-containing protein
MENAGIPSVLLPEWFERQAAATPDAVALTTPDAAMTYAELNSRANRLARHLVALGAGPEKLVAVVIRRSAELIVAFLSVLKSGAAYLPIELDNPLERIAFMMRDARPVLVVTTEADRHVVEGLDVLSVVLDDRETSRLLDGRSPCDLGNTDRTALLLPGNTSYVIYTSGSTGTPKGVVIEHRALVTYLAYAQAHYPSVRGLAVLQSSAAFDMTITTLYTPLVSGGCVHVSALEELSVSPDFLKVTPSHLALLSTLPDTAAPTGELVVGGEMLLGESVAEFRRRHPDVTIINEYGPTEATVGCCAYFVRPGDSVEPGAVAIGYPTWTTELYVLDEELRLVAAGEVGELYINSEQLARGYLHRPGLTAERFVPDPFGQPGSRMYRTGDRARLSTDGKLEFLGRLDSQVKIRGYRIELGEIESVFLRHPDVGQVAVAVHDQHVVAYVVSADGSELDERQLREHAAVSLPGYMVPDIFVELSTLPLNANGKLDTRALPVPRFNSATSFRAPRTPEQKLLCDLFARYSGTETAVGVGDDFFALGGTSLGAAQVVNEARKHGLMFTVRDLITNRTVAKLSDELL